MDCNCLENRYDPVCGGNNVMYYSPCYAGCHNSVTIGKKKVRTSTLFNAGKIMIVLPSNFFLLQMLKNIV